MVQSGWNGMWLIFAAAAPRASLVKIGAGTGRMGWVEGFAHAVHSVNVSGGGSTMIVNMGGRS
jgi:hypothetical protein